MMGSGKSSRLFLDLVPQLCNERFHEELQPLCSAPQKSYIHICAMERDGTRGHHHLKQLRLTFL